MPKFATLRVYGHGGIEVELITRFLEDLRRAYASLFVFDSLFTEPISGEYFAERLYFDLFRALARVPNRFAGRKLNTEELEAFIPLSERLILQGVRLSSPGDWEFLGALNPLEVIRKSLNDHHERRKDREYREAADRKRLELENEILASEALTRRVRLAKELGATERDLAPLLNQLVHKPLRALGRHQTEGLIENAELTPQPARDEQRSD